MVHHHHLGSGCTHNLTSRLRNRNLAGVLGHLKFNPSCDKWRLRSQQRHGLPLHVRTHQCAVRIIVLHERDERRCDRDKLLRRNVKEVHTLCRRSLELTDVTHYYC